MALEEEIHFRAATALDADAVCALVNSAYRGQTSRRGWTTEADFLDGQRIDPEMFDELLREPGTRVELAFAAQGTLVGCVELRREGDGACYLGMLTVDPRRQRGGLGHRLLERCENLAREWGCRRMRMRVIEGRTELIAYYERRGYGVTGEREPFPQGDPRFGIPKQQLSFVVLTKEL